MTNAIIDTSTGEIVDERALATQEVAPEYRSFLVNIEQAVAYLAQARDVGEVRQIRDYAEAARVYAKQMELGRDAQNRAAEIVLHAERRFGQLLKDMPKHKGGYPTENHLQPASGFAPTLADLGVKYNESARAQQIADMPEEVYTRYVDAVRDEDGDLTRGGARAFWMALRGAPVRVLEIFMRYGFTDPAVVEILKRGVRNGSAFVDEIELTGYVQPGEEAEAAHVTDGADALQKAIDLKSQYARATVVAASLATLPPVPERYCLYCGDFRAVMPTFTESSIDAVVTDPPYPVEFLPLYGDLAREAARVLKPGGSLLVMCGQSYLPDVMALMTAHLNYHWMISYLTPGGQSAQLWTRKVNTFWKPVLWFVKGTFAGAWAGDVVKSDGNEKALHEWQQSESGMLELLRRYTRPGDTVLDPFMGAGTTGVAALACDRQFVGIDLDATAFETAVERLGLWTARAR